MKIRAAARDDVPLILAFIRELAAYEKLVDEVVADEAAIAATLFGRTPRAEVLIAEIDDAPVGFALFFHNYSTFLARPGIFLEDLFVRPEARRARRGARAARPTWRRSPCDRGCGRLEWAVLDWNRRRSASTGGWAPSRCDDWTTYRLAGAALSG